MCDREQPRFLSYFHVIRMDDDDATPLDAWLESNIPDDYRVISVMADKQVAESVRFVYHIITEHHHG